MPVNNKTVLILGASGRFGRAATRAFAQHGWTVRAQARSEKKTKTSAGVETLIFDPLDQAAMARASKHCAVIVNALNPPYQAWKRELPRLTRAVIDAAHVSGATIMLPGNIYNFGVNMPPRLTSEMPQHAKTGKGKLRIEMENSYRAASAKGIQTLILRMGDFLERKATGNWFDTHMTPRLGKGKFLYPGRTDIPHAWAYLPDAARAAVALAEKRQDLRLFEDIPFGGTDLTGEQMRLAIENTLHRPIGFAGFPWWALRLAAPFSPLMREVLEMRYLWDTPHSLDNSKLEEILPNYRPTPLDEIMGDILTNHLPAATSIRQEPALT